MSPLGFGHANVVVAAPKAWIDVRTMADLDDVASAYRAKRGERMRVATKYVNLTRRFFAEHGIADYRIVESLGATEGAPASGAAELIVDITTTGATLAANALKPLDDGNNSALAGDAHRLARRALGRECEAGRARHPRPDRRERGSAAVPRSPGAAAESGACRWSRRRPSASAQSRRPARTSIRTGSSRCIAPATRWRSLPDWLLTKGAERVSVAALEQTFAARNALYEALERRIGAGER